MIVIDIAHEALICHWPRLHDWIDNNREFKAWRDRFGADVKEWLNDNQKASWLLRDARLVEAEKWLNERADKLTHDEKKFIEAGHKKQKKTQRLTVIVWLIIFIMTLISGMLFYGYKQAETKALQEEISKLKIIEEKIQAELREKKLQNNLKEQVEITQHETSQKMGAKYEAGSLKRELSYFKSLFYSYRSKLDYCCCRWGGARKVCGPKPKNKETNQNEEPNDKDTK